MQLPSAIEKGKSAVDEHLMLPSLTTPYLLVEDYLLSLPRL